SLLCTDIAPCPRVPISRFDRVSKIAHGLCLARKATAGDPRSAAGTGFAHPTIGSLVHAHIPGASWRTMRAAEASLSRLACHEDARSARTGAIAHLDVGEAGIREPGAMLALGMRLPLVVDAEEGEVEPDRRRRRQAAVLEHVADNE